MLKPPSLLIDIRERYQFKTHPPTRVQRTLSMILRMNTDKFFTPLKIKSGKLFDYLNELVTHDKDLPWERHFGWDALEVDSNWIQKDYALRSVNKLYPIKQLGILKTPPDSLYQFHKDQYRLSTINMLISEKDAHCFFIENRNDGYYCNCAELMYEPRTYYMFNNQAYHGVTNKSKPRYMFSLYFENEIEYPDLQTKLASLKA